MIYKGGWESVYGYPSDLDGAVTVKLSTDDVSFDLSRHTNVTLEIDDHGDRSVQIDLDHPNLPREYQEIRLKGGTLTGKFERRIKVRDRLRIDDDMHISNPALFADYFSYVKILYMDSRHWWYFPRTTRYLHAPVGIESTEFAQYINQVPWLRSCKVYLQMHSDYTLFYRTVRENIHRLDKSIVDWLYVEPNYDTTEYIQTLKQWFTNYTLALCFYKVSRNHQGLFQVLSILVRNNYIQEDDTIIDVCYEDCPDYL
jgi:hypothetical protein